MSHQCVPAPARYEPPADPTAAPRPRGEAAANGRGDPSRPLPPRFWAYCAFTATTMVGFATFGVLSFHMVVRGILPAAVLVSGKLDGRLPRTGELNPDNVRSALGLSPRPSASVAAPKLPAREPPATGSLTAATPSALRGHPLAPTTAKTWVRPQP